MTLLQFLVEEALAKNRDILNFVGELSKPLQQAKGLTFKEIESLEEMVQEMNVKFEKSNDEIKQQFSNFILEMDRGLNKLKEVSASVKKNSCEIAAYFCEKEKSFKLNDFLEIITKVCDKVKACKQELVTRKSSRKPSELKQEDIQLKGTGGLHSLTSHCDPAGNVSGELANNPLFRKLSHINSNTVESGVNGTNSDNRD